MNRRCLFIFKSIGSRRKESEISSICLFLVTHLNHELTRASYELRVWVRARAQLKTLSSLLKLFLDMVPISSADVTRALRGCFRGGFVYVSFLLVSNRRKTFNAVRISSLIF